MTRACVSCPQTSSMFLSDWRAHTILCCPFISGQWRVGDGVDGVGALPALHVVPHQFATLHFGRDGGADLAIALSQFAQRLERTTTIMGTINKHVEMPTLPPGSPGLFRCAAPGFMETAFRKGGLKDIAVKHVDGELRFNSAQEYWSFMTEISPTVVAGLTRADEPTRKKIETTVLDLARKTSPDGKPRLAWSATIISASK